MDITLSVDEETVERAREVARNMSTSLDALVQRYLEEVSGIRPSGKEAAAGWKTFSAETRAMVAKCAAAEPYAFHRGDAYEPKRTGNE